MSYDVPIRYEPQIQQIALAQHISTAEALERVIQAGIEQFVQQVERPPEPYSKLFGSVTGKGAHGSKEAVDRYIQELRSEW
jgi:hypothetical protein